MKTRISPRRLLAALLLLGTAATQIPMYGQTGKKTVIVPVVPSTGIPRPDSLSKYGALLDKGDSISLAKVAHAAHPGPSPAPRSAVIFVLSRAAGDSIVLRWGPSTAGGWSSANKTGYVVTRGTVRKDGSVDKNSIVQLTQQPLLPWTMPEWSSRADHADRWAAAAAGALHAKSFVPEIQKRTEVGQIKAAVDELLARYAYAMLAADNDPVAANGLALRYVDRSAVKGTQYVYTVRPARKDTAYAVAEGGTVASPGELLPNPPPPDLQAESLDRLVILRWSQGVPGARYGGFYISRSDDGGTTYRRLNAELFIPGGQTLNDETITYPDSSVVDYHQYRYRVQGVTPFGDLSDPAEADALPRDVTPPPAPRVQNPIDLGKHGVKLAWDIPSIPLDLRGFIVLRSALWQTGYHAVQERPLKSVPLADDSAIAIALRNHVLAPTTREYTDTISAADEPYYVVVSVDTAGNVARSLPVYSERIDTTPPSVPTGLTGSIDTLGIVTLHWHRGPEPNLLGYRVYWSNSPVDTFAVRVGWVIPDTSFTDTIEIHTLTKRVFYKITAVTRRYVPSKFSPILALVRPDVVPPASPLFTSVLVSDTAVTLQWTASTSADVSHHRILRRPLSDTLWKALKTLGRSDTSFVDREVVPRTTYEYAIEAIDSSGLHSKPSPTVVARPYDTGIRPPVQNLRATYLPKDDVITLTWAYRPVRKEKFWFVIYRESGGNGLTVYKSVDGTARTFKDSPDNGKGKYRYAVKVATEVGGQPPLSEQVTVDVQ